MIKKIISGGQAGAERAGLDTAIKLKIPHGGWIPKGRKAEDGQLSDKYQLQEMITDSYPARTERNVVDSDGTLIISHGPLTGGSADTRKMAMKHGKPWFHTNLNKLPTFQAGMIIEDWISKNKIHPSKKVPKMKRILPYFVAAMVSLIIFTESSYSIDIYNFADQSSYRCRGGIAVKV